MHQIIRNVWFEVRNGQNADIYITLAISVTVVILGLIGSTNQNLISAAILAVLTGISFSILQNRRQNNQLQETLQRLNRNRSKLDDIFSRSYKVDNVKDDIRQAKHAFFWGITLAGPIRSIYHELAYALEHGLRVRVLLIKPSHESIKRASLRSSYRDSRNVEHDLIATLTTLVKLQDDAPTSARIEVKVIDYLPPWTFIQVDSSISVALLPFMTRFDKRPSFLISKHEESHWYEFFLDQAESAWNIAEMIDLSHYRTS